MRRKRTPLALIPYFFSRQRHYIAAEDLLLPSALYDGEGGNSGTSANKPKKKNWRPFFKAKN
jgi:hypothetical protein